LGFWIARGLSATAKQKSVLAAAGLAGARIDDLVCSGEVDPARAERLLREMKAASRPVPPTALGVLGEDHLSIVMEGHGVEPASIRYRRNATMDRSGLPFVLEVAFGVKSEGGRLIYAGVNWSASLALPVRNLPQLLQQQRIDAHDPVVMIVHLAHPRVGFTDRGKGTADV
jgi:hypothetical protein